MFYVLSLCRRKPEAHRLHERLLEPCDDYCFFIMKTITDSVPRWDTLNNFNNCRFSTITFSVDCVIITFFLYLYVYFLSLLIRGTYVTEHLKIRNTWPNGQINGQKSPTIKGLHLRIAVFKFSLQYCNRYFKVVQTTILRKQVIFFCRVKVYIFLTNIIVVK